MKLRQFSGNVQHFITVEFERAFETGSCEFVSR